MQLTAGEKTMSNIRLGQHRADTLKPRKKTYDIRDGELKGFGLWVLPSGKKRYFVHSQHRGQRIWKNIGDAGVMSEPEARARAVSVLASIRNGEQGVGVLPEQTVFEVVAEEVFRRYQRNWKPGTFKVNRGYYSHARAVTIEGGTEERRSVTLRRHRAAVLSTGEGIADGLGSFAENITCMNSLQ